MQSIAKIIFLQKCSDCDAEIDSSLFEADDEKCIKCKYGEHSTKYKTRYTFIKQIEELGGKIIGKYERAKNPVECICKNGHKCNPTPSNIRQNHGMCQICVGHDSGTARSNFIKQIEKLGGKVIGEYKGNNVPVECACKFGHKCNPNPTNINKNQGMCLVCVNQDPEISRRNFIENIEKLGGKVIGEYKGNSVPVECTCKFGHKCNPRPGNIQQDQGMCKICAKNDLETARDNFTNRIKEIGGTIIGEYQTNNISVECICPNGHNCNPRPSGIRQGEGMCSQCNKSMGETLVELACNKLFIPIIFQARNAIIPTLRYDYSCIINDQLCYIEFDGIQHFKYISFFHATEEDFHHRRRLDLIKTFVCRQKNIKLIRIDHTWCSKPLDEWVEFLKESFSSDKQLVLSNEELYKDWIYEMPSEQIITKYCKEE